MAKRDGTTRLSGSGQVTIPKRIREALRLEEGTIFRVIADGEQIVLIPQSLIDQDQAWFWTEEWQEGEREAEEDIRAGRMYGPFKTAEEMLAYFEKHREEIEAEMDGSRR